MIKIRVSQQQNKHYRITILHTVQTARIQNFNRQPHIRNPGWTEDEIFGLELL